MSNQDTSKPRNAILGSNPNSGYTEYKPKDRLESESGITPIMIMMIFCLKSRRGGVAELMEKGKMERGAVLDKQDLDFPVHSLSYCWHACAS